MIDFDNLPTDPQEAETLVNSLDKDNLLATINVGRNRVVQDPDFEPSEMENRVMILLVRRFRALRQKKSGPKAESKAKSDAPLDSLL